MKKCDGENDILNGNYLFVQGPQTLVLQVRTVIKETQCLGIQ